MDEAVVKEIDNGYAVPGSDEDPGWVTFKCALCGAVLDYTPRKICFLDGLAIAMGGGEYPAEWEIPDTYTIRHRTPDQYPGLEDPCIGSAHRSGVRRADGFPRWTVNPPATAGGTDSEVPQPTADEVKQWLERRLPMMPFVKALSGGHNEP